VLPSTIARTAIMKPASNVSLNILEKTMEQYAPYVKAL